MVRWTGSVNMDDRAKQAVTLNGGGAFFRVALVTRREEIDGIAKDGTLEFVSVKVASELVASLS